MKKTVLKAIAALVLVCGAVPAMAEFLPGSEWTPTEVQGVGFEPSGEVFIRFEQDGRFFGNAGCNTMRGGFVTNGDAILLSPAAMTMMACPGDSNLQEFIFSRALSAARFYERDGTELTLKDGGGVVIMRLAQRDAD